MLSNSKEWAPEVCQVGHHYICTVSEDILRRMRGYADATEHQWQSCPELDSVFQTFAFANVSLPPFWASGVV